MSTSFMCTGSYIKIFDSVNTHFDDVNNQFDERVVNNFDWSIIIEKNNDFVSRGASDFCNPHKSG